MWKRSILNKQKLPDFVIRQLLLMIKDCEWFVVLFSIFYQYPFNNLGLFKFQKVLAAIF